MGTDAATDAGTERTIETASAGRTLDTELFGRPISIEYTDRRFVLTLLGARLLIAVAFLESGVHKLRRDGWTNLGGFSSEGFLQNGIHEANPFYDFFKFFLDYTAIVDPLVMWGQILIGVALLLGVALRFAVLCGAIQMTLFYMAALQGGLLDGLPLEETHIVDSTTFYFFLLVLVGLWGAGRILGLDAVLEETEFVQRHPRLRYLLG